MSKQPSQKDKKAEKSETNQNTNCDKLDSNVFFYCVLEKINKRDKR